MFPRLQASANDSLTITEFNRRRKLVKTQCEELGAYTSREKVRARMMMMIIMMMMMMMKVRARMIVRGAAKRAPGVEDEEEMWTLLKRCLLSTIHCLAVKYFNQRKCEGLLLLSRKTPTNKLMFGRIFDVSSLC